jgi:hypothetical protein
MMKRQLEEADKAGIGTAAFKGLTLVKVEPGKTKH